MKKCCWTCKFIEKIETNDIELDLMVIQTATAECFCNEDIGKIIYEV